MSEAVEKRRQFETKKKKKCNFFLKLSKNSVFLKIFLLFGTKSLGSYLSGPANWTLSPRNGKRTFTILSVDPWLSWASIPIAVLVSLLQICSRISLPS